MGLRGLVGWVWRCGLGGVGGKGWGVWGQGFGGSGIWGEGVGVLGEWSLGIWGMRGWEIWRGKGGWFCQFGYQAEGIGDKHGGTWGSGLRDKRGEIWGRGGVSGDLGE